MTGFARASGSDGAAGWSWEVKSVNRAGAGPSAAACRRGLERLDPGSA